MLRFVHPTLGHRPSFSAARTGLRSSLVGLSLVACGGGSSTPDTNNGIVISSQGAALTAVQNTELTLNGMLDSGGFVADSNSLAEALTAMGGGGQDCTTQYIDCPVDAIDCTPEYVDDCTTNELTAEDLQSSRTDMHDGVADLVKYLRDEVFIEANVDASATNETQVTYRLGPDLLCSSNDSSASNVPSSGPSQPAAVDNTTPLDPECVANAERAKLRVRLTQPRDGDVDLTVIVTEQNYEPLVLQLYHDRLGAKLDLTDGLKALDALGSDVQNVDSLAGQLQLQLIKNAPVDYSVQFSILEAFELKVHDENGQQSSYSVAKSSPAFELRADGNSKTISASYKLGAIQLMGPLGVLASMLEDNTDQTSAPISVGDPVAPTVEPAPEKTYTGVLDLLVAGFTGTFSYQADSDTFHFNDVSFGGSTSTLKHDGNVLAALDLNRNDGRGFNLDVQTVEQTDGANAALVTIDPTIDVNLAFNFSSIADQVDNIPEPLLSDRWRFWFEGNTPAFSVENEQIRMVSGSLHMASEQSAGSNVDVTEGMCLVAESETAATLPTGDTTGDTTGASSLFGLTAAECL